MVSHWITEKIIPNADRDIYEYGLELVMFSVVNIFALIITVLFTNRLIETIFLIVTVIPLQCFGGGYHATTHLRCFLIMYIGWWCVIALLPYIQPFSATVVVGISLFIIYILAPVSHKNVNLSTRQREKMKKAVRFYASGIAVLSVLIIWLSKDNYLGIVLTAGIGVVALSMLVARTKAIVHHL
jgi:accessory gene regulator B